VDLLRAGLDRRAWAGWTMRNPEFMGALAEGLAGTGRLAEAFGAVDAALAQCERGDQRWCEPELRRLKGEFLLLKEEDRLVPAAESYFAEALALSREQGALLWELRAALSLARLQIARDRRDSAKRILRPVYDNCSAGHDVPDLLAARALLSM
jgi:predicted ATPase